MIHFILFYIIVYFKLFFSNYPLMHFVLFPLPRSVPLLPPLHPFSFFSYCLLCPLFWWVSHSEVPLMLQKVNHFWGSPGPTGAPLLPHTVCHQPVTKRRASLARLEYSGKREDDGGRWTWQRLEEIILEFCSWFIWCESKRSETKGKSLIVEWICNDLMKTVVLVTLSAANL